MTDALLVDVVGSTCTFTLNRPEVMNALDMALRRRLGAAVREFEADPALRVGILTGAGGRAFSAGDDLKEMAAVAAPGQAFEIGRLGQVPGFDEVRTCRKPLIAAVDGWCLAGGFELALYCDLRLATRSSRFGLPEPRRGVLPGPGLHDLPRLVPRGEAMRVLLTGGHLTAERAHEIGLVQELADDADDLRAQAHALADEIARCAPLSVEAIKRIVHDTADLPIERAWALAEPHAVRLAATEDALEGPRAFAEKRPPRWQGR
ncbi:MAG TPA: enoyl-CoA hydratase-related protein [Acidimicrobiales bacterium]